MAEGNLSLDQQMAVLRTVAEQFDHMSIQDRVDVLISIGTQAIEETLLLADSVLEPAQAALLREKAKEETGG